MGKSINDHLVSRQIFLNLTVMAGKIPSMSVAADKVAELLALPVQDRAFLAHELIASLDDTVDADAEAQWMDVIDRRSREIEEGQVECRPVAEAIRDIRAKLHARHPSS
jgi:hypothetical protein